MSKARTLADFISDGSEFADGTISVAEVSGAAPLASPTFTGTVGATTITSTGGLTLNTTDANGTGVALGLDGDKKVRFYDDQGATTKMYWNASTVTQKFEDNSKLVFGSSEDLQLYHDGLASYITENGTGSLFISGSNMWLKSSGGDTYILCNDTTDTVSLYQANAKKLETSSTGVEVTGKTTTDELDLNAIAATISDTAVDIFVYDTRKDSDGGAWRKRTQHTSWYNETLNTATRGSRKEFPAVAVIVIENLQLTIYDGDDPDLPMWMVINAGGGQPLYGTGLTSVAALNGQIFVGAGSSSGALCEFYFIKDYAELRITHSGSYNYRTIANRNVGGTDTITGTTQGLVNREINDVAMTVLPNAPIDAATGLPVPTIAVATDGGVSVIKDDGNVYDISGNSYGSSAVTFEGEALYGWRRTSGTSRGYMFRLNGSVASLTSDLTWPTNGTNSNFTLYVPSVNSVETNQGPTKLIGSGYYTVWDVEGTKDGFAASQLSQDILNLVDENEDDPDTGSVAYVASDYNTGWMNGDIKLATLSDTDDTNVTGSELVTNGTFDSGVSGWNTSFGSTITWNSGSQTATVTSNGSNSWNGATQNITGLTVGKTYVLTADIITSNNWGSVNFAAGANSGVKYGSYSSWNGGSTFPLQARAQFTATATSVTVSIDSLNTTNATVTEIDNISVRLAEEDRSVNGNGLQVFGTVTKSAVATGADLVAYTGFSTSNYLEQPYNSDLDFGTGDFSITGWFKSGFDNGNYQWLLERQAGQLEVFVFSGTGILRVYVGGNAIETGQSVNTGTWNNVCYARRNGVGYMYLNGELKNTTTMANTVNTNNSSPLRLGARNTGTLYPTTGSLALWRISATAPSPEQIKKIYEDEKVLFQEGAQATLYGTSDAVTALAYDDSTNLLHVGTSAGRSVFQGLRRVDNTTTAVGAAISASNGLVADE